MWFIYAQDDVSYRVFDCLLLPLICIIFEYRDLTTAILVKHFNTLAKLFVKAISIKIAGYRVKYQFIHSNYHHIQLQCTSAIQKILLRTYRIKYSRISILDNEMQD